MEKLMEVMCCTDEQMVSYATFKLTAEAELWWTSKKDHLQQQVGEGISITWKNFKDAFLERFYPQSVRLAKAQEFTDLVQGLWTVEQYAARFIELSRFVPVLSTHGRPKGKKVRKGFTAKDHESGGCIRNWKSNGTCQQSGGGGADTEYQCRALQP